MKEERENAKRIAAAEKEYVQVTHHDSNLDAVEIDRIERVMAEESGDQKSYEDLINQLRIFKKTGSAYQYLTTETYDKINRVEIETKNLNQL